MKVVYLLRCPRSNEVKYVGEGAPSRPWAHSKAVRAGKQTANPRLTKWIADLHQCNLEPVVEVVQRNMTKQEALDLEEQLIKQYGRKHIDANGVLLNVAQRGLFYDRTGANNPMYGKKMSSAAREAISASKRGKPRDAMLREKLRNIALNRPPWTEESKAKLAAAHRRRTKQVVVTDPDGSVTTYRAVCEIPLPQGVKTPTMIYQALNSDGHGRGCFTGWKFQRPSEREQLTSAP